MAKDVVELGDLFKARILEAKDNLLKLEFTFSQELWPVISLALRKSTDKIKELEEVIHVNEIHREERQYLEV